jgi:hypothetical protein
MVKKSSRKTPGLLKAFAFLPLFCQSPRTAPARAGAAVPAASCRENVPFFLMTRTAWPYANSIPFGLLIAENTPALPMSILLPLLAASPSPCNATRRANPANPNFIIGNWVLDIGYLSATCRQGAYFAYCLSIIPTMPVTISKVRISYEKETFPIDQIKGFTPRLIKLCEKYLTLS